MKGEEARKELRQLGDTVREQRKKLRISQEDFAEVCDLHRTYIGQVERGEVNISFRNVLRIAKALKLRPSQLLNEASL